MMLNSNCNCNEILHPPPIPLTKKNPGSEKKDKFTAVTARTDPAILESSTAEKKVEIFTDGDGEDCAHWVISCSEIQHAKPLETGELRLNMAARSTSS